MRVAFYPIVLACTIAKILSDPDGKQGSRQQKGQAALASLLGVTETTANQWYWGRKPVSITYCVRIEQLTRRIVTRQMMRPKDWKTIWPDLEAPDDDRSNG